MIKPAAFGYNEQTASTNSFQKKTSNISPQSALNEFDSMVNILEHAGIEVMVINDTLYPTKPDAVFPNNWFSTHLNNTCFIYPMLHHNRRIERRMEILERLGYNSENIIDLSYLENEGEILEGTGSLVLDHQNKIAYAALSPRTTTKALNCFSEKSGFEVISFRAYDRYHQPVYHTNVVMALTPALAIIGLDIVAPDDREKLIESFKNTQKEIITLSALQIENFAGNMLCLRNKNNELFLIMSQSAYQSLSPEQVNKISEKHKIISIAIPTIESIGGGSVRCMMAELF
ncbi:MAG: amidinotransferase [Bacteroidia bacterium]|nr:amidinotransferase [Bacteroidia bacterium]